MPLRATRIPLQLMLFDLVGVVVVAEVGVDFSELGIEVAARGDPIEEGADGVDGANAVVVEARVVFVVDGALSEDGNDYDDTPPCLKRNLLVIRERHGIH